jgi:hypothetical protein
VIVGLDQPRCDILAAQVDDIRLPADVCLRVGTGADEADPAVLDRKGFRVRLRGIHGFDLAVEQNTVGLFGRCRGH